LVYCITMCNELGVCATIQKWLIFIVNIILFIAGVAQIGIATYILVADSDDLGFAAELFEGNDSAVNALLGFGIIFVFISFWACIGAMMHSTCMLWIYAIILFLMILGQAMSVAVVAVSVEYGDSIFGSLWQELEPETIADIEDTYKCCSFNGNSSETWEADAQNFQGCSTEKDFDPMQSCWQKFEGRINENYNMVKGVTSIFLGFQILIYFSTHYVIQSIAEAEGGADAREEMVEDVEMNSVPVV